MNKIISFVVITLFSGVLNAQNSFSAKLTLPSEIIEGNYTKVILEIFKPADTRLYTVFSQQLPPGFFVKMINIQDAVFSYQDNELILTWMRSPAEEKFTVEYEIAPMVGISGTYNLSGKLTYMAGSTQGVFELNTYPVKIVKEISKNEIPKNKSDFITPTLYTTSACANVYRTVQFNKKKNVWEVTLIFNNKESGTYSIAEKIPKNFEFIEIDSQNAMLLKQNNMCMYSWKNVALDKELKIIYQLKHKNGQTEKPVINGKLSFLKNGQILNAIIQNQE